MELQTQFCMSDLEQNKQWFAPLERAEGRLMFLGISLAVLGVLALLAPFATTFVATISIGVVLIAGGILRLFHGFEDRHKPGVGWLIVSALFYLGGGLAILWAPIIGMLSLTLVLGTFFLFSGVSKGIRAFGFSGMQGRGFLLIDSLVTTFLGLLLLIRLPATAFWALGVIVGVDLIFGGGSLLMLTRRVKAVTNPQ